MERRKKMFLQCAQDSVKYLDGSGYNNRPVNLILCKTVYKSEHRILGIQKPSIEFEGNDTTWVFNNEKERDIEYLRIMDIDL